MAKITEFRAELLLIIAGLSFGNIPILSRILNDNNVSTVEQVMIRAFIGFLFAATALFVTWSSSHRQELLFAFSKTNQFYYVIQGFILNIMIVVYFIAIALNTPVGEAALLVQIQPMFTLLLGTVFLSEKLTKSKILSLILAFSGLFVIIHIWELNSLMVHAIGDLFALMNGVFYSIYLIVGRLAKDNRAKISPLVSISFVLVWMFITFLPMALLLNLLPLPPIINAFSITVYNSIFIVFLGLLLGLFGSVLPYGLIMIASRYVESSRSAILLLGEPLGAIIFGYFILGEPITFSYIIGGGLLLGAILYLTISGTKPNSRVTMIIQNGTQ